MSLLNISVSKRVTAKRGGRALKNISLSTVREMMDAFLDGASQVFLATWPDSEPIESKKDADTLRNAYKGKLEADYDLHLPKRKSSESPPGAVSTSLHSFGQLLADNAISEIPEGFSETNWLIVFEIKPEFFADEPEQADDEDDDLYAERVAEYRATKLHYRGNVVGNGNGEQQDAGQQ